jgi:hypothetical protein
MKIRQPFPLGTDRKKSLPFSLFLMLLGCLAGIFMAYLRREGNFILAFGDTLMIEALVMFGVAWVGYLKKDGIHVFQPRKSMKARTAESWKDRIPSLGEIPSAPQPMPEAEGPESADYQRVATAEDTLRKRIMGESLEGDERDESTTKRQDFAGSAALAGLFLLILALVFEYIVPMLLY